MSLAKNPKEFFLTYDAAVPFPVSKLFLLLYVKLKTLTGLFIVSEFSVKNFLIGINKLRVKTFLFFLLLLGVDCGLNILGLLRVTQYTIYA